MRMRAGIRTIDVLALSVLTAVVVLTTSAIHLVRLSRVTVEDASRQTETLALEIVEMARHVMRDTQASGDPADVLRDHPTIEALMEAHTAHSAQVVYAMIVRDNGEVLAQSALAPNDPISQRRPYLEDLVRASPLERLWTLYQPGSLYEVVVPLEADGVPFATIHLGTDTSLVRQHVVEALHGNLQLAIGALVLSWLFAFGVSHLIRGPVRRLGQQIDRLRRGEVDLAVDSGVHEEFNDLSRQLQQLGQEMHASKAGLLAQKETLEQVIDRLNFATLLLDENDRILFCNRSCSALIGVPIGDAIGLELTEVLPEAHPISALLRQVQSEHKSIENVRCEMPAAERFRECSVSVFEIPGDKGANGHVVLIEDLGSLRSLQSLVDYATRASTMGKVASGVVHEVKNPLNVMTLQIDLLRSQIGDAIDGDVPEEIEHSLERLNQAMINLDRVVRGSLDYLRPKQLSLTAVDLNALLERVADFFFPEAERRGIVFVVDPAASETVARADEGALWQVLSNLVVNAFDGTPAGGSIRLNVEADGEHGIITVTDTGAGMRPETLRHVFQLYYTTKQGGTGIGLAMVQRLMLDQDGSVSIESEPGQGTAVTLRLPLVGTSVERRSLAAEAV
ncbi:MAG TPA: ATP-binding protein [Terriglobales bacterium]|nr:ATP-binding protein [Terriglobales bacterium]